MLQGFMLIDWETPMKPTWQWSIQPQRVYTSFEEARWNANGFKKVVPVVAKVSHNDGYARYYRFV